MKIESLNKVTFLLIVLGTAFHIYVGIVVSTGGPVRAIIVPTLNIVPYLACLLLFKLARKTALFFGVVSLLLMDVYLFSGFLMGKSTFGFAMIGIFTLFMKLGISLLVGFIAGQLIEKHIINQNE